MSYESIPSLTNLKTQLDSNIYDNNSNAISGQDVNDAFDATIDNVSRYSSLFPNFDLAIPKQTIEFDVASTDEYLICSLPNTNLTYEDLFDKVGFRITVTGTSIKQVVDVVAIWGGGNTTAYDVYVLTVNPGGLMSLYPTWPKTLNSGYPWFISFKTPNATQRHIKIDVYYDTANITWVSSLTAAPYNSTYHSYGSIGLNSSQIKSLRGIPIHVDSANSATYAGMITSYLSTYMGGGNIYTAGAALTANNLIFQGTNGKGYPISTTNVAIRPTVPIALCGTNRSANGDLSYGDIREKGIVSFANTSATYGTFAQGDEVYLRCSLNNGAIYSDGVLANAMSAGYTWIEIGHAQSATTLSYNTSGKSFLTLDANGKLTHVNGQEIAMPNVSMAVSTSSTLADNTYHKLSSTVGTKTFTLPTISDTASVHNIIIAFTTSSSPNITFSSSATIMYASDFALEASKTYEVNCLWNGTVWVLTAFAYESAS